MLYTYMNSLERFYFYVQMNTFGNTRTQVSRSVGKATSNCAMGEGGHKRNVFLAWLDEKGCGDRFGVVLLERHLSHLYTEEGMDLSSFGVPSHGLAWVVAIQKSSGCYRLLQVASIMRGPFSLELGGSGIAIECLLHAFSQSRQVQFPSRRSPRDRLLDLRKFLRKRLLKLCQFLRKRLLELTKFLRKLMESLRDLTRETRRKCRRTIRCIWASHCDSTVVGELLIWVKCF
jgi:hypothetical protein